MSSDIREIQEALYHGLRSCALFDRFNVVLERELLANSEMEVNAIWQTPRDGQTETGIGLLVEMPRLEIPRPNSLQRQLVVGVGVIEERNLNMAAGVGTGVSAEELAELVLDFMHGWMPMGSSALVPESAGIEPARDLVDADGVISLRTKLTLRRERWPMERCGIPAIGVADGVVTLTASDAADVVYYTMNGGLPGKSNPLACLYMGPFTPAPGQLNYCAWNAAKLPSHVVGRTISTV